MKTAANKNHNGPRGVSMSNYKNMSAAFVRAVIVCLVLGWMTLPAHAQEIPDFGSGAASSIIEDAPVRAVDSAFPVPADKIL